jgi:hypothetical protein
MRKSLALAVTGLTVASLAAVVPGTANAADTASKFTLAASSGLAIAVPDGSTTRIDLGTGNSGDASLTGSLGNVTVTDGRGALVATWTASAVSTDFTTGTATADETVAGADVSYFAGVGTAAVGQVGAFTPANVLPVAIGSSTPVGSWTGTGNNTVTWNPQLTFTLAPSQVAGTYNGTITHSVS